MIAARLRSGGSAFAAGLARKAALLAQAHAEQRLLARRADPLRWRMARLLWPLFTKG
ncbi:hypothetical protein U8326_12235 [Tsuneonella sp. CC-YZS046]|uniref:hypothetical protein n=1 Tax=Tsuneonella sp. CC-YZS046 TaxID=3042152 RepID=UPI002D78AA1B|nr:hypothetical protein [Tsuneonella sp. CC-YZS046]WRO65808.1 hypothetical protein U8326_12235 [Tsuneonella sp. CC-YZS046]